MKAWNGSLEIAVGGRTATSRVDGQTMPPHTGMSVRVLEDMVCLAGEYTDDVQFTFGTSALNDAGMTREKVSIRRNRDMEITLGGAFLQVAVWQQRLEEVLSRAVDLGFATAEVFGSIPNLDLSQRGVGAAGRMRKEVERGFVCGTSEAIAPVQEGRENDIVRGGVKFENIQWEPPARASERHTSYLQAKHDSNVNPVCGDASETITLETLRWGLKGAPMDEAYRRNPAGLELNRIGCTSKRCV